MQGLSLDVGCFSGLRRARTRAVVSWLAELRATLLEIVLCLVNPWKSKLGRVGEPCGIHDGGSACWVLP